MNDINKNMSAIFTKYGSVFFHLFLMLFINTSDEISIRKPLNKRKIHFFTVEHFLYNLKHYIINNSLNSLAKQLPHFPLVLLGENMNTLKIKSIYSFHCLFVAGVIIFGSKSYASEVTSCEMNPESSSQLQKLYTNSCALNKSQLKNMTFDSIVFAKGGKVENALAFLALKGFTFNEVSKMTQKENDRRHEVSWRIRYI